MSQQRISGAFPVTGFNNNPSLIDNSNATNTVSGAWSQGSTVLTPVQIQPALSDVWSIVAWTISFFGTMQLPNNGNGPFGMLGKLYGGFVYGSQRTSGPFFNNPSQIVPFVNPMQNLPSLVSSIALIWDGSVDPPFPGLTIPQSVIHPITHTEVLNTPLQLTAGETVSMGLWLTPSLVRSTNIQINSANFAITYDDNKPVKAGWLGG